MNTKRKVVLAAVLIVSHLAFFIVGGLVNRHTMLKAFAIEVKKANADVSLGLYSSYRYIALTVKAKQYEKALCAAELSASEWYDDLKACLANQNCGPAIEQRLHERAPEVFGEAPLKFTYIAAKDGIRACEQPSGPSQRKK